MEIDPLSLPWNSVYKILIGSVVPRPIGWISTIDPGGCANLAPFSFFNVVCANPPHVLFCPMIRGTDQKPKDTLRNIRSTGEFVVNIVTEGLAQAMNLTSTELPAEVNEFEISGLTPQPSATVRPPRVAQSPVHFECKVATIFDIGDQPGSGSVVIGHVIHIHVREDVLIEADKIDLEKLKPIGRLAGSDYCRVTDLFQMIRPPSQIRKLSPPY
jgi:flavin reductase (DIM6/NTAB) family NADH-FMN oxidoreductase RutF